MVTVATLMLLIKQNRVEILFDLLKRKSISQAFIFECLKTSARENNEILLEMFLQYSDVEINSSYAEIMQILFKENNYNVVKKLFNYKHIASSLKVFDQNTYLKSKSILTQETINNF
jgi:hypothetical protein